ncbi:hypothetical protein PIB30_080652, partial [Stylosanthes scabra]|nr:hypothetical protein [Stylosanthes scabra]
KLTKSKRDTFHQSPSSQPSPKATFPSRFSQAKRDKHDNTKPSKHLGSHLAHVQTWPRHDLYELVPIFPHQDKATFGPSSKLGPNVVHQIQAIDLQDFNIQ